MSVQLSKPDAVKNIRRYFQDAKAVLDLLDPHPIQETILALNQARLDGRHIYVMGNGGSASTASHFVCDLGKNTRVESYPAMRIFGLADNIAVISAYGNDDGYENVFALQLEGLLRPGDVVIAISTSGNSPNILRGVEMARRIGALTIGLTGFDAGKLGPMVDIHIHVPSHSITLVEDVHLMVEHTITNGLYDLATRSRLKPLSRSTRAVLTSVPPARRPATGPQASAD